MFRAATNPTTDTLGQRVKCVLEYCGLGGACCSFFDPGAV